MARPGSRLWARSVGAGLVLCVALAGCGGGGASDTEALRAENEALKAENEKLRGEVEELEARAPGAGSAAVEPAEETVERDESTSAPPGGGPIAAAGPGGTRGEEVPGIMPKDFPLPEGAVIEYADEGDYNFNLDFVLDSDLVLTTSFYEEKLVAAGWEEVDRTEYEQDGLKGVETSWERGKYIPKGSPNEPNYEQNDQTLTLTLQEIEPSGVGGRIFWNSSKLLNEST